MFLLQIYQVIIAFYASFNCRIDASGILGFWNKSLSQRTIPRMREQSTKQRPKDTAPLLLSLRSIALPVERGRLVPLPDADIVLGSCTVFYGPNGCGKSYYSKVISGEIAPVPQESKDREAVHYPNAQKTTGVMKTGSHGALRMEHRPLDGNIRRVAFDRGQCLLDAERRRDQSNQNGGQADLGTSVASYLGLQQDTAPDGPINGYSVNERAEHLAQLIRRFHLHGLLNRGLRALSTGELRKAMLLKALSDSPLILILDDPFDGLDAEARHELLLIVQALREKCAVLLFTSRKADIPDFADHVIMFAPEPRIFKPQEPPTHVLSNRHGEGGDDESESGPAKPQYWSYTKAEDSSLSGRASQENNPAPVIEMVGVSLSYRQEAILRDIHWTAMPRQVWKICGPNGSGKTTLMELINGDNPKAYGQPISLFGQKKGSGESVWEIKRRIGIVSPALHLRQSGRLKVREVILSGLFDSVGLYDRVNSAQETLARQLAIDFGLERSLNKALGRISFGAQRIALIARALIKQPELLILDEPCNGLDDKHSDMVLRSVQSIAEQNQSTILYISHNPDEHIEAFDHQLNLVPHELGGFTAQTGPYLHDLGI